ncbi:abortive infection family protein [Kitasatospora terrestris]|uniref:Abortive infection protein-like C-terminal domain-containing protein n=1 Tax=Kitasatospora terrestris TaxID=258051 RepID=A0ABP9EUY5_9ACTN
MAPTSDLIARAARNAIRGLMSGLAQAAICEYWENEHFAPNPDFTAEGEGGVRKQTFDSYASAVDWTDEDQARRALRVFESLLRRVDRDVRRFNDTGLDSDTLADLREAFARTGCLLDDDLRIHPPRVAGLTVRAEALSGASGIKAELDRLRRFGADYPDDAIGAAKQLIEATAKFVLLQRGLPVDDRHDVPALVKQAQQSLLLHPGALPGPRSGDSPDNAESIRRVLGALTSAAVGVAELRNRFGTGHGRLVAPTGLGPRHARLAVGTAATWCELMLDTLADPDAPWRKLPVQSADGTTT